MPSCLVSEAPNAPNVYRRKLLILAAYGFKSEFEAYLDQVEESKIHSLEELIQFNKDNEVTELPPREPSP